MASSAMSRLFLLGFVVAQLISLSSAAGTCSSCRSQCSQIVHGGNECEYPPLDPTYSYFLFVLQWPGTYCQNQGSCCDNKFPQGVDWTIHGLWPEKSQDCYPYCCDLDSVKFTHAAIADLKNLRTYWPTLSCKNTEDKFHGNEWDKHGTCALEDLRAQSSDPIHFYFKRTLELREKLPLAKILARKSIVPSDTKTYKPAQILSAIRAATGATPDLDCKGQLIDEVHFCLDKDLETYIDCPTEAELDAEATFNMVAGRRGAGRGASGSLSKKKRATCPDQIRIPTFKVSTIE